MSHDVTLRINAQDNATQTMQSVGASLKNLVVGFSGLATSAFALYSAYDRVQDASVRVDRANLMVKSSANSADDAQRRYNAAVEKYGPASEQAIAAAADVEVAVERQSVAIANADKIQGDYNDLIVQSALTVIPTVITATASLSKVRQALSVVTTAGGVAETAASWVKMLAVAPTATLTAATMALNAALYANPIILVVAAIGALIAAFVLAYNYIEPFRNAVNDLGKALMDFLQPAIDAVYNALKWLWDNVLVPIANFLGGIFLAQIKLVADALSFLGRLIGDAFNFIVETVQKATGQWTQIVERNMQEQVDAVDKAMNEKLKVVQETMDKLIIEEKDAYDQMTSDAIEFWTNMIDPPVNAWDEIIDNLNDKYDRQIDDLNSWADDEKSAVNEHYDDLENTVKTSYETQLDDAKAYYQDLTDTLKSTYDTNISETEAYYDSLIAMSKRGQTDITDQQDERLREIELIMLREKKSALDQYHSNQISKEEYEARISKINKDYNEGRSIINDRFRLMELEYEKEHAGEVEKLESDKAAALADITAKYNADAENAEATHNQKIADLTNAQNRELERLSNERKNNIERIERETNNMVAYLNTERNNMINKIRADQQRIETEHQQKISQITLAAEQEQARIIAEGEAEKQRIIAESVAKIQAYQSTLKPSSSGTVYLPGTGMIPVTGGSSNANTNASQVYMPGIGLVPIPGMANGGFVRASEPMIAAIGEGGSDEVVSPVPIMRQIVREESGSGMQISMPIYITGSPDAMTIERLKSEMLQTLQSVNIETGDSTSRIRVKSTNNMTSTNTR